jgi:hypothetical protein
VPELWLVDYRDLSVEVWRSPAASDVVRDVIRWRVPGHDLVVPVRLPEVFAGLD